MKRLILFLYVCFLVVGETPAFAITFDVWEVTNENILKINDWIGAQSGSAHVLEDFEDIDAGWYTQKDTGVGTFIADAEGQSGTGATSYNKNHNKSSTVPYFSIQDRDSYWYGRSNTTPNEDASQWLDSGDITLLTLTLDTSLTLTNLFFYIQDPSDYSETTMFVNNNKDASYKFSNEADKASFFVGISLADGEVLSTLSWLTQSQSDGFGLDDFSTIHNPEPATMLLFGFGLIGIAAISRRMT